MIVVADASPIICLSRIGRLALLREVFVEVVVPEEVGAEIAAGPHGEEVLRSAPWLHTRCVHDREWLARLHTELDLGEAAAIVLATETGADLLLMDERRGRAIAEREGLAVVGIVGVLLRAKHRGLIPAIGPVLDDLVTRGRFHLAPEVISRARALADETT